jgi:hypothetical protein
MGVCSTPTGTGCPMAHGATHSHTSGFSSLRLKFASEGRTTAKRRMAGKRGPREVASWRNRCLPISPKRRAEQSKHWTLSGRGLLSRESQSLCPLAGKTSRQRAGCLVPLAANARRHLNLLVHDSRARGGDHAYDSADRCPDSAAHRRRIRIPSPRTPPVSAAGVACEARSNMRVSPASLGV